MNALRGLLVSLAVASAIGCSSGTQTTGSGGTTDEPAPAFPKDSGQEKGASAEYPAGPYGVSKGSVIQNFHLIGFADASTNSSTNQLIQMADFYNPDGKSLYPEGHAKAGQPKPKALLIDVASVWCGPCNYEAGNTLPGLHAKYAPMGGEFMLQLADGPQPNIAATVKNLFNWTKKYKVNYPATIDPSYKLGSLFAADAFPMNMIIDTSTMKICTVVAGAPEPTDKSFWGIYEKLLAGDHSSCK